MIFPFHGWDVFSRSLEGILGATVGITPAFHHTWSIISWVHKALDYAAGGDPDEVGPWGRTRRKLDHLHWMMIDGWRLIIGDWSSPNFCSFNFDKGGCMVLAVVQVDCAADVLDDALPPLLWVVTVVSKYYQCPWCQTCQRTMRVDETVGGKSRHAKRNYFPPPSRFKWHLRLSTVPFGGPKRSCWFQVGGLGGWVMGWLPWWVPWGSDERSQGWWQAKKRHRSSKSQMKGPQPQGLGLGLWFQGAASIWEEGSHKGQDAQCEWRDMQSPITMELENGFFGDETHLLGKPCSTPMWEEE